MRNDPVYADIDKFRKLVKSGMADAHAYVVLLGLARFDFPSVVEQIGNGLPYSAYERLQKNSGFSGEQLGELLQIPRRTLARRKSEGRFSPDESDRLVRAARVYAQALHLFDGDREDATGWLTEAQRAFAGVSPLEMARTEVGAKEVERLIGQLEHGVLP